MPSVILPGEVGSQLEPRLTVEGLRNLLQDMRTAKQRMPSHIIVSEYDRRDLNQDLCAGAKSIGEGAEKGEHDGNALGIIEGVIIQSHPEVARGKARLVFPTERTEVSNKLGGEGLIIVGAG